MRRAKSARIGATATGYYTKWAWVKPTVPVKHPCDIGIVIQHILNTKRFIIGKGKTIYIRIISNRDTIARFSFITKQICQLHNCLLAFSLDCIIRFQNIKYIFSIIRNYLPAQNNRGFGQLPDNADGILEKLIIGVETA